MSNADKKLSGYTNIAEIVYDYINETGNYTMKDFMRLSQIVIRGITKLNIRNLHRVEVADLEVNTELYTTDLPDDYIDWVRLGLDYDGRLYPISHNPNLILPRGEDCGVEDRDVANINTNVITTSTTSPVLYLPFYTSGTYTPAIYGLSGGWADMFFRIDDEYRRIILEGEMPVGHVNIRLEYISSGVSLTTQTVIPLQAKEVLIAWLRWRTSIDDPGTPFNKVLEFKNLYGTELAELDSIEYKLTLDQLRDAGYRSQKQGMKR